MAKLGPKIIDEVEPFWMDEGFREEFFNNLPEIILPQNSGKSSDTKNDSIESCLIELRVENGDTCILEDEEDEDPLSLSSQNLSAPSWSSLTSTTTTASSSSSSSNNKKRFINFRKCCKTMKKWLSEDPRIHLPPDPEYLFPQFSTAFVEAKRMKASRAGRPRVKTPSALAEDEKEYHRRYYATTKKCKDFISLFTKKYSDGYGATMKLEELNYPHEIDENSPSNSVKKHASKNDLKKEK